MERQVTVYLVDTNNFFRGKGIDGNKENDSPDFSTIGKELHIPLKNKDLVHQILTLSESMQEAIARCGFGEDAGQALFLFVSEISNNALKARGSYEIFKKYGSFENLVEKHKNHRDIINRIVEQNYSKSEIIIRWQLNDDSLLLVISNNTPLNAYFEHRVAQAMSKQPNITEEFIEQLTMSDSIFDTKASGIGMGLSMAVAYAAIAGGSITFDKSKDGWTSFRLILKK